MSKLTTKLRGLLQVQFLNYSCGFYVPCLRLRVREISLCDLISFVSAYVKSAVAELDDHDKISGLFWFRVPLPSGRYYYFSVSIDSLSSRGAAL